MQTCVRGCFSTLSTGFSTGKDMKNVEKLRCFLNPTKKLHSLSKGCGVIFG
jgi:hypothetical protein